MPRTLVRSLAHRASYCARNGRYLIIGDSNLSGLDRPMDQSSPRPGPGIKRPRSMAQAARVFPKRPPSFPHNRGYLGSEISACVMHQTFSVSDACITQARTVQRPDGGSSGHAVAAISSVDGTWSSARLPGRGSSSAPATSASSKAPKPSNSAVIGLLPASAPPGREQNGGAATEAR